MIKVINKVEKIIISKEHRYEQKHQHMHQDGTTHSSPCRVPDVSAKVPAGRKAGASVQADQ